MMFRSQQRGSDLEELKRVVAGLAGEQPAAMPATPAAAARGGLRSRMDELSALRSGSLVESEAPVPPLFASLAPDFALKGPSAIGGGFPNRSEPSGAGAHGIGAPAPSPAGGVFGRLLGVSGQQAAPELGPDIRGALADNAMKPKPENKFGFKDAAGIFADMLLAYSAAQGNPLGLQHFQNKSLMSRARMEDERARSSAQWDREKFERTQALERDKFGWQREKDSRPEVKVENGQIFTVAPDGSTPPVFLGRVSEDAELYAEALGLAPDDDGYDDAIRDYVLKDEGPTGFRNARTLQGERLAVSRENNIRTTSTSRDNNIRSTGTARENNIRSTTTARDNNIRSTNTSRENNIRGGSGRGGRGRGGGGSRPRAMNAQKEVIEWDGKEWVKVR